MDEKKFALFAWMKELHCFAWMKHLFICLKMRTFDRKPVFKLKTNNANKLNFSVGFHLKQNKITVFAEKKKKRNYNI